MDGDPSFKNDIVSEERASLRSSISKIEETYSPKPLFTSELTKLISLCQQYIESDHSLIKTVKYPKLLVKYLKELRDDVIGLESVKDAIASQIMYLITINSSTSPTKSSPPMLHTVIYGPPGVGKTTIGVKLAKIWYALGYLEAHESKESPKDEIIKSFKGINNEMMLQLFVVGLMYGYLVGSVIVGVCKKLLANLANKFKWVFIGFIIFIGLLIWFLINENKKKTSANRRILFTTNKSTTNKLTTGKDDIEDNTVIKIVSREDFVAGYLGQTAIKTKNLLEQNIGKVLFVDEAYSLLNKGIDPYGMEALTTINLFMSENPNKLIIIFAGYKELMETGIFKAQPGLVRRFMWHFECQGYKADQLYDIFKIQLKRAGWRLPDDEDEKNRIFQLIRNNEQIFKSYAGDTERLGFFAGLQFTKDNFETGQPNNRTLTYKHIEKAINLLQENNISKDSHKSNSHPDISSYLDLFR